MGRTLFDKLWDSHRVATDGGGTDLIWIDRIFLHERTGSIALNGLRDAGHAIRHPAHVFGVMDHILDTTPGRTDDCLVPGGRDYIETHRAACRAAGIRLFDRDDPDQGIVHVIAPEQGLALPGLSIVCPDSHTCTLGGLGALAFGIGSSDAEHALATGTLPIEKPKRMRVWVDGALHHDVTAKDLILHLIGAHGAGGASGMAIEFAGPAIAALEVEARLTLCNMAVEFAAFTGLVAPDDKTIAYLKDRPEAPTGGAWDAACRYWTTLSTDDGATFDAEIRLDAAMIVPTVTWGTSPGQAAPITGTVPMATGATDEAALVYMGLAPGMALEGLKIDAAFLGSCTNARLSDLRAAAAILKGRRVADHVRAICVPGSRQVRRAAEAEGLDAIFKAAGFDWRESGCSLCFYAGGEGFGAGARIVSSTNRNFEGRQGKGARTHLASPATVAASAIRGALADPRKVVS